MQILCYSQSDWTFLTRRRKGESLKQFFLTVWNFISEIAHRLEQLRSARIDCDQINYK
jgi:hypothetical protein